MSLLRTSALVCSVVLCVAGCDGSGSLTDEAPATTVSDSGTARWNLDPASPLTPETTTLQLIVLETGCASGSSAEGRIEATVSYSATEVEIEVIVEPVRGDATCPGNPPTPFTLELSEPLGDRSIVGEQPIPD
ncbi:MAG: hypothetical protein ABMA25_04040 [Ilumatobacteraceae bacterium]